MSAILLVEDDASVREAVSLALEGEGHRVSTAASGTTPSSGGPPPAAAGR